MARGESAKPGSPSTVRGKFSKLIVWQEHEKINPFICQTPAALKIDGKLFLTGKLSDWKRELPQDYEKKKGVKNRVYVLAKVQEGNNLAQILYN
jgi:hypothetical protein